MAPRSIKTKLALLGAMVAAGGALLSHLVRQWLGHNEIVIASTLGIAAALGALALGAFWQRRADDIKGLSSGLERLGDQDFSAQLKLPADLEFRDAIERYNQITETLRVDRQRIHQRELLLDTLVRTSPAALLLIDDSERVVLSNFAARRILHNGARMEGAPLRQLLQSQPAPVRLALAAGVETIVTIRINDVEELHHFSSHLFQLNARSHRLLMLVELTQELGRQEIATWKHAIRVISHEINNALAPVKSLAHSGQQLLAREVLERDKLKLVLKTVEERAQHLATFISGYAEFARLPKPRLETVGIAALMESLQAAQPCRVFGALPQVEIRADRAQLEAVLTNLLKNAAESGSTAEGIDMRVQLQGAMVAISVRDRGTGFSEPALKQALLPFFSTKADGTGLGLALTREIIDAHGGRVSLGNRASGGAHVTVILPVVRIPG